MTFELLEIQTFFIDRTFLAKKILFSDHFIWHHYAICLDVKRCVTADQIIIKIHFEQIEKNSTMTNSRIIQFLN